MVEQGGNTRIMSNSADEQTISKVKSSNILSCFVDEVDFNLHVGWWPTEQASQNGLISTHFSIRIYLLSIFCAIVFKNWHLTHFPYSMLVSEKSNYLPKLNKTANKSLENRTFSTNFNK